VRTTRFWNNINQVPSNRKFEMPNNTLKLFQNKKLNSAQLYIFCDLNWVIIKLCLVSEGLLLFNDK
jgi:hypothetical protein